MVPATLTPAPAVTPALLPCGDGGWRLWNQSVIRSAGFPAAGVLRLADERLAAAADDAHEPAAVDGAFARAWDEWTAAFGERLAPIARSRLFRLAVTWQNPRLVGDALDPLLRQIDEGRARNSRRRGREQLLVNYWQRYCLKNESIGFFGPVAWATVGGGTMAVTAEPGRELSDRAAVHLERWPVDALARQLDRTAALDPWLRPRRLPWLQVLPDRVVLPDGSTEPIDPLTHAVLCRADGTVTARDLAARLVAASTGGGEDAVFDLLGELRRRRWLVWKLELPASVHTEDDLRALLERVDDASMRAAVIAPVDRLIAGRRRVQAVWDDPDALLVELGRLADDFVELTGQPHTRHHGRAYGGRTLAYLECRRDVSVRLGQDFVDALRPLTLVLDSVRWLTWRIRQVLEPEIRAAYRALRERIPTRPNAAMLWIECVPLLARLDAIVAAAVAEFHERWRSVLRYDERDSRSQHRTADLAPAVLERFDAPAGGWTEARLCSPDVMVAAHSADGVAAGEFHLVLGELHVAMNSSDFAFMVSHHPNPDELFDCLRQTFPGPRLLMALPTESRPRFTIRSHPALVRDEDFRLAVLPHQPPAATGTGRPAGDAPVLDRDGRLTVLVDGSEFDVLDLFAEALKRTLIERFTLFPADHRPRITVDRMVLARELWTFPAAELDFAALADEPARFAAARRWAREQGLPRQVFVKSPTEVKPFYVDLAGPAYVELLTAGVRSARREIGDGPCRFTFTEMLPTPDQAWLPDADGNRYTAECRLTMCDQRIEEDQ